MEYWRVRESNMATDPIFFAHDKGSNGRDTKRMSPTTARKIVKSISIIAGIDPTKFSPHYFRHAFAIRVLAENHDLAITQDLLGHEDPKSTRVYAKIESEDLQDFWLGILTPVRHLFRTLAAQRLRVVLRLIHDHTHADASHIESSINRYRSQPADPHVRKELDAITDKRNTF